jgi:hypothetical protein
MQRQLESTLGQVFHQASQCRKVLHTYAEGIRFLHIRMSIGRMMKALQSIAVGLA